MAATVSRRAVRIAAACYYPLAVLLGVVVVINANERGRAVAQFSREPHGQAATRPILARAGWW